MRWLLDSLNFVFLSMLGGLLHSHDRHWSTRAFDFVIRNFLATHEITKICEISPETLNPECMVDECKKLSTHIVYVLPCRLVV